MPRAAVFHREGYFPYSPDCCVRSGLTLHQRVMSGAAPPEPGASRWPWTNMLVLGARDGGGVQRQALPGFPGSLCQAGEQMPRVSARRRACVFPPGKRGGRPDRRSLTMGQERSRQENCSPHRHLRLKSPTGIGNHSALIFSLCTVGCAARIRQEKAEKRSGDRVRRG